jgi:hypothetical protein
VPVLAATLRRALPSITWWVRSLLATVLQLGAPGSAAPHAGVATRAVLAIADAARRMYVFMARFSVTN